MKLLKWFSAAIFVILTLAGCDPTDRLVWSPDGKRFAVISSDGLRIGDDGGRLSKPLLDRAAVEIFRWLPDSKQALIVLEESASNWQEVNQLLTRPERAKVISQSEKFWRIRSTWPQLAKDNSTDRKSGSASFLYLKYKYGEKALRAALPDSAKAIVTKITEPVYRLALFKVSEDKAEPIRVLLSTVHGIGDVRLDPAGGLAAVTEKIDNAGRLVVLPIKGGRARVVSEWAGQNPEWSRDGRALYYIQTSKFAGQNIPDQIPLASLVRQEIADYDETLLANFEAAKPLVQLPYSESTRIRCLAGGEIIFDAQDLNLPSLCYPSSGQNSASRWSLFKISRDWQTVTHLVVLGDASDAKWDDFEVNQDGTRAVVPGSKGEITVVDLTTGKTTAVEPKGADLKFAPQWRSADELCFPARNVDKTGGGHDVEVVLQSMSQTQRRILSKNWPASSSKFLNDAKNEAPQKGAR